jgi:hypothetical protein
MSTSNQNDNKAIVRRMPFSQEKIPKIFAAIEKTRAEKTSFIYNWINTTDIIPFEVEDKTTGEKIIIDALSASEAMIEANYITFLNDFTIKHREPHYGISAGNKKLRCQYRRQSDSREAKSVLDEIPHFKSINIIKNELLDAIFHREYAKTLKSNYFIFFGARVRRRKLQLSFRGTWSTREFGILFNAITVIYEAVAGVTLALCEGSSISETRETPFTSYFNPSSNKYIPRAALKINGLVLASPGGGIFDGIGDAIGAVADLSSRSEKDRHEGVMNRLEEIKELPEVVKSMIEVYELLGYNKDEAISLAKSLIPHANIIGEFVQKDKLKFEQSELLPDSKDN